MCLFDPTTPVLFLLLHGRRSHSSPTSLAIIITDTCLLLLLSTTASLPLPTLYFTLSLPL